MNQSPILASPPGNSQLHCLLQPRLHIIGTVVSRLPLPLSFLIICYLRLQPHRGAPEINKGAQGLWWQQSGRGEDEQRPLQPAGSPPAGPAPLPAEGSSSAPHGAAFCLGSSSCLICRGSFHPGAQVTKRIHTGRYHRKLLQTAINRIPQRVHWESFWQQRKKPAVESNVSRIPVHSAGPNCIQLLLYGNQQRGSKDVVGSPL